MWIMIMPVLVTISIWTIFYFSHEYISVVVRRHFDQTFYFDTNQIRIWPLKVLSSDEIRLIRLVFIKERGAEGF